MKLKNIKDNKYYESILTKNNVYYEDTILALGIVKKYIINNGLILVGGMAIDFSMKLKGKKLYDDDVLPDYDFYSSEHHKDAYKIAECLRKNGLKNISVINATHTTTMRVRVNFIVVADVTYIPEKILNILPTLIYKEFKIIHPHVQIIDQHRSLSLPYENSPWEVIIHRWKKDMERYDLLYENYPLDIVKLDNIELCDEIKLTLSVLNNTCLTGIPALLYWLKLAKEHGFKYDNKYGYIKEDNIGFIVSLPKGYNKIPLYSFDIKQLGNDICNRYNIKKRVIYNKFLDKFPFTEILDKKWKLMDSYGMMISAYKTENNIYIANLQNVMMYLLTRLLYKKHIVKDNKYKLYINLYLLCRDILLWVNSKKNIKKLEHLFPTYVVYGDKDISDSYINSLRIFLENINHKKKEVLQPRHVYDKTFNDNNKIPEDIYKFDRSKSYLYDIDGEETNTYKYKYIYLQNLK